VAANNHMHYEFNLVSGAPGRLSAVAGSLVCRWPCSLAAVRGRCCTSALYFMRLIPCPTVAGLRAGRRKSPASPLVSCVLGIPLDLDASRAQFVQTLARRQAIYSVGYPFGLLGF